MAGALGGGGATNAAATQKYTQLDTQTSAYGLPIRLFHGKKRLSPNVIYATDFLAIPEKNGGKKGGGKGGDGKGAGGVVYDYFVAVILALCEGPLAGIDRVWSDKDLTTLAALGLTLIPGTGSDAVWAYLTSNHPDQADAYAYTAKLVNSRYALGKSPNLPNNSFECISSLSGSMPGTVDVNFGDVIPDFLTNPQYSIGLDSAAIDATSLAFFKTYQQAQGLFFSPDLGDGQEQLSSVIDRYAQLSNSWIFFSGGAIKFVPLGDAAITANGVTYTPNLTAQYDLTYEDFVTDDPTAPPIAVSTADDADLPNHVALEIKDRALDYNANTIEWRDEAMILEFGTVDASVTQAHEICDANVAAVVAQLIGQRGTIPRTYKFMLGAEFFLLEPGDPVTLTDAHLGLTKFPVRIRTLDEDEQGRWSILAEELALGVGTVAGAMPQQLVTPNRPDFLVDPGDVNPPAVIEPSADLTGGTAQLWISVSGGPNWGAAAAFLSLDDLNYDFMGSISNPAYQGVLTSSLASHADPDTVDTLAVDTTISDLVLPTNATHDDAVDARTLALITPAFTTVCPAGEIVAYGAVAAGAGPFDSNITDLRRGLYGTAPALHATGAFFTRIELNRSSPPGNSLLIFDLPAKYIGRTLYLKFVSINRYGQGAQDIATVTAYTYTPTGAGFGGGSGGVPATPTGLAASALANGNALTWSANAASDNVSAYGLYRAAGHGASFGSASLVTTAAGTAWNDLGLAAGSAWTYFLVAENGAGNSAATAGVDATAGSTPLAITTPPLASATLAADQVILDYPVTTAFTLPAGLTGSLGGVAANGVTTTADTIFVLAKNGVSIGTAKIPAGATLGANAATFTVASAASFAAGDHFTAAAPHTPDATLQRPFFAFLASS
jgi:hypothetical protein